MDNMEGATPVMNKEQRYKNSKSFEIKILNESYELKVGEYSNKILFYLTKKDNSLLNYENEYSFEELIKINENFKSLNSIQFLFNSFGKLVQNNKVIIEKDEQNFNNIKLGILISNPFFEEIKCLLNLKLIENQDNISNKSLIIEISKLKKEISEKNEEIKQLKEKIENLEKKMENIEKLNKKIESIEKLELIEKERKRIEKLNILLQKYPGFAQSDILKEPKEINLLVERFKKEFNNISFELLYKLNEEKDEFTLTEILAQINRKTNILFIFQTTQNVKFGGYTSLTLRGQNQTLYDDKAFLFSLSNNKIYNIKKGQETINDSFNHICFIGGGFNIYGTNNIKSFQCLSLVDNSYEKMDMKFELNNGEQYFFLKNLEVFHVINI